LIKKLYKSTDTSLKDYLLILEEYSANNNLMKGELQIFDTLNKTWINRSINTYSYDSNNNFIFEDFKTWDKSKESWIKKLKYEHFWSEFETSGLNNFFDEKLSIYPNPASNTLEINSEINFLNDDVDIYSISGDLILKTKISSNDQINLNSIPSGIYYLRLNTQKGSITKKIIKIN